MSSRKENQHNRTTFLRRNDQHRLNFGSNTNLNITVNVANSKAAAAQVDNDLLLDLAYSQYLSALSYKQHSKNQINKYKNILNDQLCIYTEILMKKLDEINDLEITVCKCEMTKSIYKLLVNLDKHIDENSKVLSPEVNEQLDNVIKVVKKACNHLYLKNIKKLDNQKEYDLFQQSIVKCDNILTKILTVIGNVSNIEKYQALGDCLKCFKDLENKNNSLDDALISMQKMGSASALSYTSDMFYQYSDKENE